LLLKLFINVSDNVCRLVYIFSVGSQLFR